MFVNPLILAGVGGAVVPLVLHLLSRARCREVGWGAMMFLEAGETQQLQSTRLKQGVLLGVRMLLVAMLAMALARPVVGRDTSAGPAAEGGVTAVIVLDRSASMGFAEHGHSRFDMARREALAILGTLGRGDRAALVLAGAHEVEADAAPTGDLQSLAGRIVDMTVSFGESDMAAALEAAVKILDLHGDGPREFYVICDRQARSWQAVDETFMRQWRQRMRQEDPRRRMYVIPVGTGAADNVTVEGIELTNPPAIRNRPAEVEVRIRNRGEVPRAALPLVVRAGGREVLRTTVQLAADSSATVRAPVTFTGTGSQVVSAAVQSSGLAADDRLEAVFEVVDPVQVLIISGNERGAAAHTAASGASSVRNESHFLRLALMPYRIVRGSGPDPAQVEVMPVEQWPQVRLEEYQVVVLANISQFSQEQVRGIEQFVYGGGGLLVAPGSLSRVENYNQALFREGSGILPARLDPPEPAEGHSPTALLGIDLSHPIFRFLSGRPDPIPAATVGRYFPSEPGEQGARVLASFATGDPFLIESAAGRGRVLLMTTPIDADWSTLPLSSFYLPYAQSVVQYLAAGAMPRRNLALGEPLEVAFTDAAEDARALIIRPDGRRERVDLVRLADRAEVRYPRTDYPGRYRVRVNTAEGGRTVQFVVRPPPGASDLSPMGPQQWRLLAEGLGFRLVDPQRQSIAAAAAEARSGRELWGMLIGAVLVLALAEMALARRWSSVRNDE